jgi:A/G-specific adenine glycosylase
VIDYFDRWMLRFPDVKSLALAEETEVLYAWQGLGYYSRARNLHRAAKQIFERHGGEVPADLPSLLSLPGLGRYTAGAVATFAFDLPVPIVDANIARVLARLQNYRLPVDSAAGQKALWALAEAMQPRNAKQGSPGRFNEALMELGALVCLPRAPKCAECPLGDEGAKLCRAEAPEQLPIKKPAAKTLSLREDCAWIVRDGRILLELQTGPRWSGLWKLSLLNLAKSRQAAPLLQMTYPFTNHRVTLSVYHADAPDGLRPGQEWFSARALEEVPITAPHRRAIQKLLAES